ncbi:hypothetical protein IAT38_005306 [Cryptococcus sp. DSM 104549]
MKSTILDFSQPERKSDAAFQEILDTFVGDRQTVLTGNLPGLLDQYERDHDVKILDEADAVGVYDLCFNHPDLELGSQELLAFLMAVIQRPTASPEAAPPTAFRAPETSTPQDSRRRRRHSDRIRSPSDSSSSSSGEEAPLPSDRRPAPPNSATAPSFPRNAAAAPPPPGGWQPIRKKTLSDPNRSDSGVGVDSPLAARTRGRAGPPSAFGFARPSPATRRRRGSSATRQEDDPKSPDLYGGAGAGAGGRRPSVSRSFSQTSITASSPQPWQTRFDSSRPASPMSPLDQVDNTSFHERAKSPETDGAAGGDDVDQIERKVLVDGELDQSEEEDAGLEEKDGLDMDDVPQGASLLPRLSRISTESTTSLRTSHDNLRKLRKENKELLRKLKETEKTLAIQGAENERMYEDLQVRLEEAQAEIAQRRKDEKELKAKDRTHVIQISGMEADILSLQRSLENSKANHASMQKMYNSQCDEAARLRNLLRDRDDEIGDLGEAISSHAADEEKFNQEIQALESEVKRLESDLAIARQAESHLEVQKQENLALKETIDRMRFDLDEARAAAAGGSGGAGHGRGTTSATASSAGGTISRNLGDELGRRLLDVEKVEEEEGEGEDGESFVETIVTRQRTRKIGGRPRSPQPEGSSSTQPIIRIDEGIREYIDASTETDPLPTTPSEHATVSPLPPAYTAEPEPINAAQVLERAHPRDDASHRHSHGRDELVEDEYEVIVDALGMRCEVLEEELRLRKVEREKRGIVPVPRRGKKAFWSKQREEYTTGIVHYIFYKSNDVRDQVGKFSVFAVAAFAVGLIVGAQLYASPAGIHPRDYRLFQQMNTLAGAAGIGEGFLPVHMLGVVETGARLVAGRIPT